MSEFPECLLIVTAEIDTAIEAEWNRWYDTVHLPDALRCPGVRRGRRYVSSGTYRRARPVRRNGRRGGSTRRSTSWTARTPSPPRSSARCVAGTNLPRTSARARRSSFPCRAELATLERDHLAHRALTRRPFVR